MRKISNLLVLAAASSALFTGAALAGGAPATLGGSASFTGSFFIPTPIPTTGPSGVQPQVSLGAFQTLGSPLVVSTVGPLPTDFPQVITYVSNVRASTSPSVRQAVRRFLAGSTTTDDGMRLD